MTIPDPLELPWTCGTWIPGSKRCEAPRAPGGDRCSEHGGDLSEIGRAVEDLIEAAADAGYLSNLYPGNPAVAAARSRVLSLFAAKVTP